MLAAVGSWHLQTFLVFSPMLQGIWAGFGAMATRTCLELLRVPLVCASPGVFSSRPPPGCRGPPNPPEAGTAAARFCADHMCGFAFL